MPFSYKHYITLFIAAFLIRAFVFVLYIQHNERYFQPDSMDYHNCTIGMVVGTGMHRPDTKEPIFWRTPGYPLYLSPFYKLFGISGTKICDNCATILTALWVQIIINSCIPFIILLLAYLITQSTALALIAAWISVFHLGLTIASMVLLSEGIALILFFLFLLYFFKPPSTKNIFIATLALAAFTWVRPMGQFVAIISAGLLFLRMLPNWRSGLQKALLFISLFFLAISPWYIRNYQLTGHWFFCPMFGRYLNSFNAPKIIRRVKGIPLNKSIAIMYNRAQKRIEEEKEKLAGTHLYVSKELVCSAVSWPVVLHYPRYALIDWCKEITKTAFDLHAHLLVAFATNTFKWDPLEEFLLIKWQNVLYNAPLSIFARLLGYLEALVSLLVWLGIILSIWFFILPAFIQCRWFTTQEYMVCMALTLIGSTIFMTGGFGYARLRLIVDPLMIIIALLGWYQWYYIQKFNISKDTQ